MSELPNPPLQPTPPSAARLSGKLLGGSQLAEAVSNSSYLTLLAKVRTEQDWNWP
jgi:hypothetical protein